MHEDMRALLNVYLDGELHGPRLPELEQHLAMCESCRDELKELRMISEILQSAPVPEFMPVDRFVSNLNLRLPRQGHPGHPTKPASMAWWLVPAGLLAAWTFVQTVFTLTGVVTAAQAAGLFGLPAHGMGAGQQAVWFATVIGLFGAQPAALQSTLTRLNFLDVLGMNLLKGFLWQALIVLLYWGWMGIWWLRRNPKALKMDIAL
jgi:anti-sigma factor RsiW